MAKLDWGNGIGLHFRDNEEYYETLAALTKKTRPIDIYTHDNGRSGASEKTRKIRNSRWNIFSYLDH